MSRTKKEILKKEEETNRDWLSRIIEMCPFNYSRMIRTNKLYASLIEEIETYSSEHLPSERDWTFNTKVYWYLNSLTEFPKCENYDVCGHRIVDDVINVKTGYRRFCTIQCSQSSEATKEHRKNTNMKRHGVSCSLLSDSAINKTKVTNKLKYGCENVSQSPEIQNKVRETNRRKYGTDYSWQCEKVKEKIRKTNKAKYGHEFATQSQVVKDKIKSTNEERYGVECTFQSESVKEKIRETNRKNWGVDYPMMSRDFVEQVKKHNVEVFGVGNLATKDSYDKMLMNEFDVPMFTLEEYADRKSSSDLLKFKCLKCGSEFMSIHDDGKHHRCPLCYPTNRSHAEVGVQDFIKSIYRGEIRTCDRQMIKPYEVDIHIPEVKLAFEYDGLYWHSDSDGSNRNYHLTKTELCEDKGIHLIHIFENEWLNKQDIVKSRICNLFGVYDKTIYARKCDVKEVLANDAMTFQETNHIQGGVHSKVNLGLYYDNELISLMTFSKPRFSKKYEWELVRFCNKLGYHVPGAASRLLKHFERQYNPKSIISYADRRWSMNSNNTVYDRLGFKRIGVSSPNYWYWKGKMNNLTLESRVKYQKHKLKNILEHFDESKSEVQNMKDNGYKRIFDCGNIVYVKEY